MGRRIENNFSHSYVDVCFLYGTAPWEDWRVFDGQPEPTQGYSLEDKYKPVLPELVQPFEFNYQVKSGLGQAHFGFVVEDQMDGFELFLKMNYIFCVITDS